MSRAVTVTAIVSVSPTRIGAWNVNVWLAYTVPGPGRRVPSTAEIRAAPHMPCATTPWKRVESANSGVDVRRIDVARHRGEQLDVGRGERALDARAIADGDLVERAVADDLEVVAGKWCWS